MTSSEEGSAAAPQVDVGSTTSTALKGIFGKKNASKKKFKTTNLNSDRQKAETKKKEEDSKREAAALARRAAQIEQDREEAAARGEIDLDGAEGWYRSMQVFQKKLGEAGLRIREVQNDGNCMFRSFVDQLGYDADGPKDYKNARKAAVQYIRRNDNAFEPFMEPGVSKAPAVCSIGHALLLAIDEVSGVTMAVYTQKMQNDKVWGGNIELQALSQHYRVNVVVLQIVLVSQHAYEASELQMIEMKNFDESAPCAVLSYHDGLHYNSVRLAEDTKKTTSKILHIDDVRKLVEKANKVDQTSDSTEHIGVAFIDLNQFNTTSPAHRTQSISLENQAGIIATLEVSTAAHKRSSNMTTDVKRLDSSEIGSLLPLDDPQAAGIVAEFGKQPGISGLGSAIELLGELGFGDDAESSPGADREGFSLVDELLGSDGGSEGSDNHHSAKSILEDTENLERAQGESLEKSGYSLPSSSSHCVELADQEESPPVLEEASPASLEDSPAVCRETITKISVNKTKSEPRNFSARTARLRDLAASRGRSSAAVQADLPRSSEEHRGTSVNGDLVKLLPLRKELLEQREALGGGMAPRRSACKFDGLVEDTLDLAMEVAKLRGKSLEDHCSVIDDEQVRTLEMMLEGMPRRSPPPEAAPEIISRQEGNEVGGKEKCKVSRIELRDRNFVCAGTVCVNLDYVMSSPSSRLALLEARIAESIPLQLQANQEMAEEIVRLRAENRRLRCENVELREIAAGGDQNALRELRVLREENSILRQRLRTRSTSPIASRSPGEERGGGFDDEIRERCASLRGRSPSTLIRTGRPAYRHAREYMRESWR
ncbi:hypothetical protein FOL47_001089 [Perkinsus chesapeaki]|uniref:OTU domain-containing protein n=1 Tax=Perkinsus chesapeaki TaxID=330153 RepID=A0A7J6MKB8_PERCH|nr:hypothetical protein FOL47_001089 [Perkinsus chesapeaki]